MEDRGWWANDGRLWVVDGCVWKTEDGGRRMVDCVWWIMFDGRLKEEDRGCPIRYDDREGLTPT